MKLHLWKIIVSLALLGSALLLLGASTGGEPQAPPYPVAFPSKVVWTPDGKHILFSHDFQGIFGVDVAGSESQAIPEDAPMGAPSSGNALPAPSPDGTRLAYVARLGRQTSGTAIMVSAPDGTGARRLTHDERFNTHPAWSPDGTEIAYTTNGKLAVMRADGMDMRVLAPMVEAVNAAPVWSPDGSRIAFVGVQNDPVHRAVYTVRLDGAGLTKLGPTVSVPSWSPDGSRIAFLMPEDTGEVSLYTLDGTGADPNKVWWLGRINVRRAWSLVQADRWYDNLSWSPDGSAVLFASSEGKVVVVSLDFLEERLRFGLEVADIRATRFHLGLASRSDLPGGVLTHVVGRWAAWSPDGSRIAVLTSLYGNRSLNTAQPVTRTSDGLNVLTSLYHNGRSNTVQRNEVYTMERDGALKRVLMLRNDKGLAAKHVGWYDVPRNIAACAEGFVVPNPDENPGLVQDCETLMAIRDRLAGDFLLNWSTAVPIIEWLGVGVIGHPDIGPPRVGVLYLIGSGPVPILVEVKIFATFATFGTTAQLILYGLNFGIPEGSDIGPRRLTGSVPRELGNLSSLIFLNLSNNDLSGSIPPELGNLSELEELHLRHNNLSGSIPPELGNISFLEILSLEHNSLGGSIPPELGNISFLEVLSLEHNSLSGNIPPELGNLGNLMGLYLQGNAFTGCVPAPLSRPSITVKTDGLEFCE